MATILKFSEARHLTMRITEEDFHAFLQGLLKVLLPNFIVETRRLTKRPMPGSMPEAAKCLISAYDVDVFLHELHSKKLMTEIETITAKLRSDARICDLLVFDAFYFPLLHKLLERVGVNLDGKMKSILCQLFLDVLLIYLNRYVQARPPAGDLARGRKGCGRCADCSTLDAFLANPQLKSKDFPVSKNRRQHLHKRLDGSGHGHDTDRLRGDTLVVTKGLSASDVRRLEWQRRFDHAQEQITKLNTQDSIVLRGLLGAEYESITKICWPGGDSYPPQPTRSIPPVQRPQPTIIDLTEN